MKYSAGKRWNHKYEIKEDRWVFQPTQETKVKGRQIKNELYKNICLPDNYWHLRKGGHVEAIRSHINNNFFLMVDLTNFFGCINRSRVTRILKPHFGYETARDITLESTVRHPRIGKYMLPYGFPQSPILASTSLYKSYLGRNLIRIEGEYKCAVSVYVDDIIISSQSIDVLNIILDHIYESTEKSKFQINKNKCQGPSKKITAFNIDLSYRSIRINDRRFYEFKKSYDEAVNDNVKNGIVNYISSVNYMQGQDIHL